MNAFLERGISNSKTNKLKRCENVPYCVFRRRVIGNVTIDTLVYICDVNAWFFFANQSFELLDVVPPVCICNAQYFCEEPLHLWIAIVEWIACKIVPNVKERRAVPNTICGLCPCALTIIIAAN